MSLKLGISPCPNDTYIFSALAEGRIALPAGMGPLEVHFADVEELNSRAKRGELDVTKLSAAAAAEVLDTYVILQAGGALGRGCGPLLVAGAPATPQTLRNVALCVPGRLTTANLLLELHGGFDGPRHELVFDAIMPALTQGRYAAGVIIHESRFTYAEHGLHLALDLGAWWEQATGAPIPLGVIVAKRSLGAAAIARLNAYIRRSLEAANAEPSSVAAFVRAHAQEMDAAICARHIATFVNEFSLDLGDTGRDAVLALLAKAAELRGLALPKSLPVFAG